MPTFNQAEFISDAIESIRRQTFSDWEAIVINNFSSDCTVELVEGFNDRRITLINYANNGVIGASRNVGISSARGKYLAFLDSDDKWFPDKLKLCIERLESGYDLVGHGVRYIGDRRKADSYFGPQHDMDFHRLLYRGNCIATSATVVRRDMVESVGGFTEDTRMVAAEDYHLWLSLAKRGIKMGHLKSILTYYRLHGKNETAAEQQNNAVTAVINTFIEDKDRVGFLHYIRIRRRMSLLSFNTGRIFQQDHVFDMASKYFLKAIYLNPFAVKPYAAFFINVIEKKISQFRD